MSRVTKLQKHYRRLIDDKKNRRRRYWAKSRRIRHAQGGKLYDWEPGHRTPVRGTWNVAACRCGHKRHGKYGCEKGCAWGSCGDNAPLMLSPIGSFGDVANEFMAWKEKRNDAIARTFMLSNLGANGVLVVMSQDVDSEVVRSLKQQFNASIGDAPVVIVGDIHHGADLLAAELDKSK